MVNFTKIFQQVGQIKVKSITDSLFRYGLLILCLATFSSILKADLWILIALFITGGVFMVIGLVFYCYFSIINPDYLRSETYQLKKQSIELLGDKNSVKNPHVDKIIYITSPYNLDEGEGENKMIK